MKTLKLRQVLLVASMLFGMFFGAGNLIFPASMGQLAGGNLWQASAGFLITGVGLPLLGVAALGISRAEGLLELSSRVSRGYGLFFTCLLYLTIGPFFAIPRCATVSYTVGVQQLLPGADQRLALALFSLVFFGAVLFFSGNYREMHGAMIARKPVAACADSTLRLKKLFDAAVPRAAALILALNEWLEGRAELPAEFGKTFGAGEDTPVTLCSAPGRTEICGNHTDHQHGRVLAAAVNLDFLACAAPNGTDTIRFQSEGWPLVEVKLDGKGPRGQGKCGVQRAEGQGPLCKKAAVPQPQSLGQRQGRLGPGLILDIEPRRGPGQTAGVEQPVRRALRRGQFQPAGQRLGLVPEIEVIRLCRTRGLDLRHRRQSRLRFLRFLAAGQHQAQKRQP